MLPFWGQYLTLWKKKEKNVRQKHFCGFFFYSWHLTATAARGWLHKGDFVDGSFEEIDSFNSTEIFAAYLQHAKKKD